MFLPSRGFTFVQMDPFTVYLFLPTKTSKTLKDLPGNCNRHRSQKDFRNSINLNYILYFLRKQIVFEFLNEKELNFVFFKETNMFLNF